MSAPYEIVSYRPAHKWQVAELESHLWCRDVSLAVRYLEWKYQENPYAPEPAMYLAFAGSELVGVRGFYGARWESGHGAARVVSSVPVADDFIVAPAHRNRGLVTLIMRAAFEDLARRGHRYVLNLSGGQVTVMGSLAMGWKSAGPLEPIGLGTGSSVARQARALLSRTRFRWRFAESPLLRSGVERKPFRRLDARGSRTGGGPISIERAPRLDAMIELVERLGHDGRIRHVRDREFFAWRFRNPLSCYRFLYHGDHRLEGFLVLQAPHPAVGRPSRVKLVDLEGSSAAVRAELLDAAIDAGRFPQLFSWAVALPDDARDQLFARGFEPVDLDARAHGCPCVLVKAVSAAPGGEPWVLGGRPLTDLAAWDLRMIYTMAG
jgi:GNAT superfamily N-acetyltransferase